jgi:hypothetical protein
MENGECSEMGEGGRWLCSPHAQQYGFSLEKYFCIALRCSSLFIG